MIFPKKERTSQSVFFVLTLVLALLFVLVLLYVNHVHGFNEQIYVNNGDVTIDDKTFTEEQIIPLNGMWLFYPDVLLSGKEVTKYEGIHGLLFTPGDWSFFNINDSKVHTYGFGTYHITIQNDLSESLRIYFPSSIADSYKVFVNGDEIYALGDVSKEFIDSEPAYDVFVLDAHSKVIELDMQVSGFYFKPGGIRKSLFIGKAHDIESLMKFNLAKDLLVIGMLGMYAIYFTLMITTIRRNRSIYLYLIYATLVAVMYTLTSNDMTILDIVPNISFKIQDMLQYMLALTGGGTFVLLVDTLFVEASNRNIKKMVTFKIVIFIVLNLILSRGVIVQFMTLFSIISVLEFLLGISIVSKATVTNKKETIPILIGTAFLLSTIIYDVFYVMGRVISPYGNMTAIGLVVFIMSFSIVVAIQYERSFQENQVLSDKLIETELGKLSAQINPHFISNAMIAVSEYCYVDPEQAAEVSLDLVDYLRYIFSYDYKIKEIELKKELELVETYLRIEKVRFGEDLQYSFSIESTTVKVPPFSIQTIVENAVKHGVRKKNGGGEISIIGYKEQQYYHIEIKDTGLGIEEKDIPDILAGKKHNGTGIGLSYVNKSMNRLYGTQIHIKSQFGVGTIISFKVPNKEL